MHLLRVRAELPPDVVLWMDGHPADLWDAVARAVALDIGRALMVGEKPGEAGVTRDMFDLLVTKHPSPAVRALAAQLGSHRRVWRVEPVVFLIERYLDLPLSGHKKLYGAVRDLVLR